MQVEADQLELEQQAFIDLVDDVLRLTPGLRYQLHVNEPSERADQSHRATFTIETNPAYDLAVAIEL